MQHGEQKSPADSDVRPESLRVKNWACEACDVGRAGGYDRLDQKRWLDVEGCRACAGIADFLALEDNVQWGDPDTYSEEPNQLGFGYNWSSWMSCEFFTKTPSRCLESTRGLKLGADPSPSTSSTQAFDTLKHWIEKCAKHKLCKTALPKQLARRILEIESIEPLVVRVVENDASGLIVRQAVPYACLTYRWGQDTQTNSLKKANLSVYKSRVPRERIYPLIEDAITAAWKLGLKYIWIDAYCIIQDDEDDWRHEAAMMGDIYENAFVTFSATPTTNKGRLFSQIRTPQLGYPITEHENTPVYIRRCLEHPKFTRNENGKFTEFMDPIRGRNRFIHTRGWVFQERMLSTRIVHFLRGELFWECRQSTWCECRSDEQAWEGRRAEVPRTIESMTWAELIEAYCQTDLTYERDRMQALSSVAKRHGKFHGKTYLAGMWFEDLPSTFLWLNNVRDLTPRPLVCAAPSWSWSFCSAQEQILGNLVLLNGHHSKPPCTLNFLGYSRDPPVDNVYADSHSVRLTIAGPTVLGTIFPRDGCVVIMGTVWVFEPDFVMQPDDPSRYRVVEQGSEVLILLCRGTEEDCIICQGVGIRASSNEDGMEMFERIGQLSYQMGERRLASLTDQVKRYLSSSGVEPQRGSCINGQRFRDQAERRTITLI